MPTGIGIHQVHHGGGFLLPALPAPAEDKADPAKQVTGSVLSGGLRAGYNLIFPKSHCAIHVINDVKAKDVDCWGDGSHLNFKAHQVPTNMSLKEFVEQIDGPEKFVVTEVWQRGGGRWQDGSSVKHSDDKAKKAISDLGWDAGRGTESAPPVWLVVEKDKDD
jgi:hypothetical protein